MYVAASQSDLTRRAAADALAVARARGGVSIAFKSVETGMTRLAELHEWGGFRAKLPRSPGLVEAVLINTGGGLLGGDNVSFSVGVGAGGAAQVTTQSAERIYRSLGPDCRVAIDLKVESGARLHWLPQETILFNEARLARTLTADLAADATLLLVEATVFGRAASGEKVISAGLRDCWRITRAGTLIYADNIRLDGHLERALARPAIGAGAAAMATVVYLAPHASEMIERARASLDAPQGRCAVSAWNGMLIARLLAPTADALKADTARLAACLSKQPLPRVWGLLQ